MRINRKNCFITIDNYKPKVIILFVLLIFSLKNLTAQFFPSGPIIIDEQLHDDCKNSGFEEGNFNKWETFTGSVFPTTGGVNLSTFTQTLDPTQHQVINNNTNDFYGNYHLSQCGNKVAKIGDIVMGEDNHKAAMIKYTFTVSQFNVNFSFRYAMVLENPDGHAASQQPFFQYMLLTGDRHYFTNTNQIITSKKFIANKYNPFYSQSWFGSTVYKDWSTECVNLSAYMGQEVSVLFIVGDCSYTAHGAYAYIDCLCENNNAIATMTLNNLEFCQGDQITMDATATINEDSYFLAIAEADQFGNVIVGTERSQWFVAQQAGIIDFTALLNQWNYNLKCNTYYKVKLAVSNGCTNWNETSKFIFIHCPEAVDIGQYIVMCCNNPFPVTIKDGNYLNHPTYTYNWTSSPYWGFMANNPNLPSYNYTPFVSTTFNVTVTDDYGCTLDDEINIILEQNFTVSVAVEKLGCCTYNLVPYITFTNECDLLEEDPKWLAFKHNMLNYHWSDGYTGKEHQVSPAQNTTYSLTVSNSCFTQTVSVNVEGCPDLSSRFPRLAHPGKMKSFSTNKGDWLVLYNNALPTKAPNAYKATRYNLRVWNRWGNLIYDFTSDEYCLGIDNEDIFWNGRTNNGLSVFNGIYIFRLTLYNNTYKYNYNNGLGNPFSHNGGLSYLDWYHYICTQTPPWWCFWCLPCSNGSFVNETKHTNTIEVRN